MRRTKRLINGISQPILKNFIEKNTINLKNIASRSQDVPVHVL